MASDLKAAARQLLKSSLRHFIYIEKVRTDHQYECWAFTRDLLRGQERDWFDGLDGVPHDQAVMALMDALPEAIENIRESYRGIGVGVDEELSKFLTEFSPHTFLPKEHLH